MSMIRVVQIVVLSTVAMSVSDVQAQTCAPSPEHWSFGTFTGSDGQPTDWWSVNRDSVCNASLHPALCISTWNSATNAADDLPRRFISASASSRIYVGMMQNTIWRTDTSRVIAIMMLPVACHVPSTGLPSVDGRIVVIGPARVAADVGSPPGAAGWLLNKTTSLCLGSGNDTARMITASMSCGGVGMDPINYNGFSFYLQGEDGDDYLKGGLGTDVLLGGNGHDDLFSLGGNDTLRGDAGDDWMEGYTGDDWYLGGIGMDQHRDSSGIRDIHFGGNDSDCIFDSLSHNVNGEGGSDICPSATRSGATTLTSCELLTGWCIPQ